MEYPNIQDFVNEPFYDQDTLDRLNKWINQNSDWEFCKVYNKKYKKSMINDKTRSSYKITCTNQKMIEFIEEKTLSRLKSLIPFNDFWMRNSHFDVLYYTEKMYFDSHVDFIKYYFPDVRLYVLLVGLMNTEKGGETKVHLNKKDSILLNGAVMTNRACLFPAHLLHQGKMVEKGNKKCIKIDIFIMKKTNSIFHLSCSDRTFVFSLNWFKGFSSFIESIYNFYKKDDIVLDSIKKDELIPIYDYLIGRNIDKTKIDPIIWNMIFPDISINDILIWFKILGFMENRDEKPLKLWTDNYSIFKRIINYIDKNHHPIICLRYKNSNHMKWNIFKFISLISGKEVDFYSSSWAVKEDDNWSINFQYLYKELIQYLDFKSKIECKINKKKMDKFDYTPCSATKKIHDIFETDFGGYKKIIQDWFDSVHDNKNIFYINQIDTDYLSGERVFYIEEWCNDDYCYEKEEQYESFQAQILYGVLEI